MISTSGLAPSTAVPPIFWPLNFGSALRLDLGEVRGQLVVLVLRPALERMVVALVAVEPHGQEQLRRVLHHRVGRRGGSCSTHAGGFSTFEPLAVRIS